MKRSGLLRMSILAAAIYKQKINAAPMVLKEDFDRTRLITLKNDKALNSVTPGMFCWLRDFYIHYPHSEDVLTIKDKDHRGDGAIYVLTGDGEKSFCAGGDVVTLSKREPEGALEEAILLELQLYYYLWHTCHGPLEEIPFLLNYKNVRFDRITPPPVQPLRNKYVSLWNGYVFGGGAGLSMHGQYRVACPNTLFAMPEASLGFFPDVASAYFLPRLERKSEYHTGDGVPGLGLYLGLMGARVKGSDLVHAGIATHFVDSVATLRKLQETLCDAAPEDVDKVMESYCVPRETLPPFSLDPLRPLLERVFRLHEGTTLDHVVKELQRTAADKGAPEVEKTFAGNTLEKIGCGGPVVMDGSREKAVLCPSSLVTTLHMQLRGSAEPTPAKTNEREYYGTLNSAMGEGNFMEGIRSLLTEKDNKPNWKPSTLAEAMRDEQLVQRLFDHKNYRKFDLFTPPE
ncbi:Enoyl-CoA hydratase/isomerase, putative [Angomonas deanei]|uniref:3-hydroxyisobutyryl-CoA hydrolase n=1 Tax=Angomonas deanei TaxID=59799 RepID=A0A7G2CB25_9TRYP|nr:Enoyl-CoA hydratase/isomerase, putative [Angomonas deanei]